MAIDNEKTANWPVFSGGLRIGNACNADNSSDSSPKASPLAFYGRGIRIAAHEGWYCSYNKTIVPELIDVVKF
jgi:hypothetical protein